MASPSIWQRISVRNIPQGDYSIQTGDVNNDFVTIEGHTYKTGDIVKIMDVNAGSQIYTGNICYVIKVDNYTIKLANTLPNAYAGAAIDAGTSSTSLRLRQIATVDYIQSISAASAIDVATNTITITNATDGFGTGNTISYFSSGGSSAGGLTSGSSYYVIRSSDTSIKLADSQANATSGVEINITSTGSGTHVLASTTVPTVKVLTGPEPDASNATIISESPVFENATMVRIANTLDSLDTYVANIADLAGNVGIRTAAPYDWLSAVSLYEYYGISWDANSSANVKTNSISSLLGMRSNVTAQLPPF